MLTPISDRYRRKVIRQSISSKLFARVYNTLFEIHLSICFLIAEEGNDFLQIEQGIVSSISIMLCSFAFFFGESLIIESVFRFAVLFGLISV